MADTEEPGEIREDTTATQPATLDNCREDYEDGADTRAAMARHERADRAGWGARFR